MHRREFVASLAAAGTAAGSAIDNNQPVRETPLRARSWGPLYYDEAERGSVVEVINTGRPFRFGRGPNAPKNAATFEQEFAARMQRRFSLAVTSGTAALETAMAALQIGPGDEVILPAWTWHSTFTAVVLAGALPVCAEIDESFNLDPADVEHRITPATKLIIAVHLQGNPADMDPILEIARKHHLKVLEDCSQAVGASYKGRPVGALGDLGAFSHQLSKTITAGEGGSLIMDDPVLFERACRYHDVGNIQAVHKERIGQTQLAPMVGTNFRMNEFTGGVMLAQIRKIDKIIGAVRANYNRVIEGIGGLPGLHLRRLPDPQGYLGTGVFLGFADKDQRNRYAAAMKAENVPAIPPAGSVILPIQPYIENKITAHPAWPTWNSERGKAIRYGAAACPRTIDILNRFAGVMIDPKFTRRDTDDIIAAIRKVYPAIVRA